MRNVGALISVTSTRERGRAWQVEAVLVRSRSVLMESLFSDVFGRVVRPLVRTCVVCGVWGEASSGHTQSGSRALRQQLSRGHSQVWSS